MHSDPNQVLVIITPLGAAALEASESPRRVEAMQRRFHDCGDCPTSKLFPRFADVEAFYQTHPSALRPRSGRPVKACGFEQPEAKA